jgi:hypothetical protein
MGRGLPHVRPPRLPLAGADLEYVRAILTKARKAHPKL